MYFLSFFILLSSVMPHLRANLYIASGMCLLSVISIDYVPTTWSTWISNYIVVFGIAYLDFMNVDPPKLVLSTEGDYPPCDGIL